MANNNNKTQAATADNKNAADATAALQKQVAELAIGLKSVQAENKELKTLLNKKAETPAPQPEEKATVPDKTFTVEVEGEKKIFRFKVPAFRVKRPGSLEAVRITAKDALTDKALLAELVAKGSGVIEEVA